MILKEDLLNHKRLQAVIESGKFEIKGEAIELVASLLRWNKGLYQVLEKIHEESETKRKLLEAQAKEGLAESLEENNVIR